MNSGATLYPGPSEKEAIECEVWGCDSGVAKGSVLPAMTRRHNQKSWIVTELRFQEQSSK